MVKATPGRSLTARAAAWARSARRVRGWARTVRRDGVDPDAARWVACEERELLYEEALAAYKNIEAVIADLVNAGLVSNIATFRPLLTYKTRKVRR